MISGEKRHLYMLLPEQLRFPLSATVLQLLHNLSSLTLTMDNIAITDPNSTQTLAHQNSERYNNANEYLEDGSYRPRHRQTAADIRTRNEYWQDEDDLTPTDQETMRRRKGRIKKSKKGTFY